MKLRVICSDWSLVLKINCPKKEKNYQMSFESQNDVNKMKTYLKFGESDISYFALIYTCDKVLVRFSFSKVSTSREIVYKIVEKIYNEYFNGL